MFDPLAWVVRWWVGRMCRKAAALRDEQMWADELVEMFRAMKADMAVNVRSRDARWLDHNLAAVRQRGAIEQEAKR